MKSGMSEMKSVPGLGRALMGQVFAPPEPSFSKSVPEPIKLLSDGTCTIAIVFRDGIVIGADSKTTVLLSPPLAIPMIYRRGNFAHKARVLNSRVVATGAGPANLGRATVTELVAFAEEWMKVETLKDHAIATARSLAETEYNGTENFSVMVAGYNRTRGGPQIYVIKQTRSVLQCCVPETVAYEATGSGRKFAVRILKHYLNEDPNTTTLEQAGEVFRHAMAYASSKDPMSGNFCTAYFIPKSRMGVVELFRNQSIDELLQHYGLHRTYIQLPDRVIQY